jgi:hypothetical protein
MCGVYTHVDIERMVVVLRSTNALRVLMALKMEPKLSGSQWDQCLSGSKRVEHFAKSRRRMAGIRKNRSREYGGLGGQTRWSTDSITDQAQDAA